MTIQKIAGRGMAYPEVPTEFVESTYLINYVNCGPIDGADEKLSFIGRVFTKDGGSKNISTVSFRFGSTVTKTNGSTLRVSLQDIATTAANPDGTADQSYTIANADASFDADTWYTATLGATRAVTCGDLLCVVWDFNGGFAAGDVVNIAGIKYTGAYNLPAQIMTKLYTSSWALHASIPNVVLGFDDGTFGTLLGAGIFSNLGSFTVANDHTPDEYALIFQVPFPMTVSGIWGRADVDGDTSFILSYGASSVVIAVDKDNRISVSNGNFDLPLPAHVALSKDTDYYVSIRPESTTHVDIPYAEVANANHWQAWDGGVNFRLTSRTDGGAWAAATTTQRIWAGVRVVGFDDGVGDFPDAANVLEADTTNGTQGTYHEATEAEVQSGVTFGPSSAYTGTYAGGAGGSNPRFGDRTGGKQ